MSVRIRLSRHGAKKKPFYRIVVCDQVGTYDPKGSAGAVKLNQEKIDTWIKRGAQPTQTVLELIAHQKKAS
jgi:small subunit ribosomal protein S16